MTSASRIDLLPSHPDVGDTASAPVLKLEPHKQPTTMPTGTRWAMTERCISR